MKHVRKVFAFALTLVMALAIAIPAFAKVGDQLATAETTIYVQNLTAGDTVGYFQLVEWNTTAGDWALTETGKICGVTLAHLKDGIDAEEAATIAGRVTGAGEPMTASGTDASADVNPGLYYLRATPADTNKNTVYNPAFVSADYKAGGNTVNFNTTYRNSAVLKKSDNEFDKSVNDSDPIKYNDVKPGDVIPYKITTTIPAYSGAFEDPEFHPEFQIRDVFSDGLTLYGQINVEYGANSTTQSNDDVTITPDYADGGGFVISFTKDYLLSDRGLVDVTVTYNARVTTSAQMNVNAMNNTATLTFSNKPGETAEKKDITRHYTFSIDGNLLGGNGEVTKELIKSGTDALGRPITEEIAYYNEKKAAPLGGAKFELTPVGQTGGGKEATSSPDGRITFTGLDAGEYILKETAAPAGYVRDSREFTVKITPTYDENIPDLLKEYTITITSPAAGDTPAYSGGATFNMNNEGEIIKTIGSTGGSDTSFINNTQGSELPSTGGIGTTIFYIVGGVMVAGAVVFLLTKRRMAAE